MHWTFNCTAYSDSASLFKEWTSTCTAGPIAKSVSEQDLLSAAKQCSMKMTTDVPVSADLGQFFVECQRQRGFETETADVPFVVVLFLIVFFGGFGVFFYYLMLSWIYDEVRQIANSATSHLKSCSCCSLDASCGSSEHLPLVKWQLIKSSVRCHLIFQAVLAPLLSALFVVIPTLLVACRLWIIALPCLLSWTHSLVGIIIFQSLGRKVFILKSTRASETLRDAAAIKAHYEEECNRKPFWYY